MQASIYLDNVKTVGAEDEGETVVIELRGGEITFMASLTNEAAKDLAEQLLTAAQRA